MKTILLSASYCFIPLVAFIACVSILVKEYKLWKALLACLLGMITVLPIAALQSAIDGLRILNLKGLFGYLISALVLNGVIEECVKAGLFLFMPAKGDSEKTVKKVFFLCALTAGLALGCLESFIYLIAGTQKIGLRMVTAVVIHTLCSGLGGLFAYSVKTREVHILPLLFAILSHGIYNYFAGLGIPYLYISFVAILFAAIECRVRYMREY